MHRIYSIIAAVALIGGCTGLLVESGITITDVSVRASGEAPDSVIVSIRFANLSDRPVTFRAGKHASLDLEVRNDKGELVWRHLQGTVAEPAMPHTLAAGSSETWLVSWPIVDFNGARVPAGMYTLVALLGDNLDIAIRRTAPVRVAIN